MYQFQMSLVKYTLDALVFCSDAAGKSGEIRRLIIQSQKAVRMIQNSTDYAGFNKTN